MLSKQWEVSQTEITHGAVPLKRKMIEFTETRLKEFLMFRTL